MKILIQNTKTKLFLKNQGKWTDDIDTAMDFESGLTAIQHAERLGTGDLEVAFVKGKCSREDILSLAS